MLAPRQSRGSAGANIAVANSRLCRAILTRRLESRRCRPGGLLHNNGGDGSMSTVREKQLSLWLRLGIAVVAVAAPATAQRAPLFKSEILPVLEKNCVS